MHLVPFVFRKALNELILLVDDEPSIIQLSRLYLEREGFRIASVGDGDAALASVAREHPALVVLDVMLPKLDGFEVCRRLRASRDPTAILMLTARDEDIDKILGLEAGADDYLTKPFNPRELVARVATVLRRARPWSLLRRRFCSSTIAPMRSWRFDASRADGTACSSTGRACRPLETSS